MQNGGACTNVHATNALEVPKKLQACAGEKSITWHDNIDDSELDVPGTPRTSRTSTTAGRLLQKRMASVRNK
jgi:hypothetical protein